ncbi:MAG TPA: hypothetical protein DCL15_20460 [Chloroflexi bacterium]|nr:hypothetical protein [Chloroflexota bacterium]HHW86146.1 serine/threonine protein kinase [Chloroflexota bacterium]
MTTTQIGAQLHQQRYRIRQQLGKGGFGAVYLADDTRLPGRQVALKENLGIGKESQGQFKREALLLARLRHPNLPQVTDYFFDPDGKQYLVMDYIPGDNLRQLMVRRQGPLSVDEALAAVEQVMQALAYMHTWRDPETGAIKPIIHRDIKPDNIKRTPDGRYVLVDFGIAKVDSDTATALSARALTPGYAPIEQYHGGTDERSDIYALAATLYALLTGKAPPSATSLATGLPLPPPRSFNADIPMRCVKVIEKAMQLKPEHRYQSIGDMYRALFDRTLPMTGSVAPLAATPARPSMPRALPKERRTPVIAALLLAGALLSIAGAGLVFLNAPQLPSVETTTPIVVVLNPATPAGDGVANNSATGGGPTFTPAPAVTSSTATSSATPTATPPPTATFTATPDTAATAAAEATARQRQIEAGVAAALAQQQAVDATLTALAPTVTPTPRLTNTPRPTPTPRATNTPKPTPRPTDTPYPTYTPYPTNTPYPTPTPLPPPTYTPQPTYTPLPTSTPPPPPSGDTALAAELRQRVRSSWVSNPYQYEGDRFIADLTGRLGQFQLPHLGVTQSTMTDALRRGGAEDRLNALVGRVWGDWINNEVNPKGYDAYGTDPGVTDMSPLRLLVIRMIQGRQGVLVDSQQHALHNFFTRKEDASVWVENVNGVIAAVNRESFQWQ